MSLIFNPISGKFEFSGGTSSSSTPLDFPRFITNVQLGTPTSPITAGSTYTYSVPLGGTYSEIFLTNFQWITPNSFDTGQPGGTLGRGSFSQADSGPILSVNTTPGGWTRIFKLNWPEYFGVTLVDGQMFDGSAETTVALGHGLREKDVAVDHPELFGTPPEKFAILDAYIDGTNLKITVKNYDSVTITLAAYVGLERVYGYRGDTKWSTVTSNLYAITDKRFSTDFWVSEDHGDTFTNYPGPSGQVLAGIDAYEATDFFIAAIDYEFNSYTMQSPGYVWSQVNDYTLPYGASPGTYRLNDGGDYNGDPYGGHPLDWESAAAAFFAFENYTSQGRLFKSVDGLVNIGDNSPLFDNGLPVFKAEDELADIDLLSYSSDARNYPQSAPIYVKVIDASEMFVSFAYKAATVAQTITITTIADVLGIAEVTDITCLGDVIPLPEISTVQCVDDVAGSLNNTAFYLNSANDATQYVFWFNSSGAGTQPSLGAFTYVEVDITDNDSAATIAGILDTAILGTGDFTTSTVTDTVTITTVATGDTTDLSDQDTGFTFNVTQQGSSTSASLNNTAFYLYSANDATAYVFWFNVDGGGTEPSLGGYNYIEVDITAGDSAATVATALDAAIAAQSGDFTTSTVGDVVTVTNVNTGATTDAGDENTGFSFGVTTQGVSSVSLAGTYFTMFSGQDINRYVPWFKVSGSGSEPSIGAEYTYLEVDVTAGDSADNIAIALKAVLDTLSSDFTVSRVSNVLTVNNLLKGDTASPGNFGLFSNRNTANFGLTTTIDGSTISRMAFFKTTNGGATWTEILSTSPDFKDSSGRMLYVSDDASLILALVQGYGNVPAGNNYPYAANEIRFNSSGDGGSTWNEPDGSWILAFGGYAGGIINEGILGSFTSGTSIIAVIAGEDSGPAVIRSNDSGATWETASKLAPWLYRNVQPGQRGFGSDAVDDFLSFTSYGYVANDATSYAYRGQLVTTFTNWQAWGIP